LSADDSSPKTDGRIEHLPFVEHGFGDGVDEFGIHRFTVSSSAGSKLSKRLLPGGDSVLDLILINSFEDIAAQTSQAPLDNRYPSFRARLSQEGGNAPLYPRELAPPADFPFSVGIENGSTEQKKFNGTSPSARP